MMDICHCTFAQTFKIYKTKNELKCNLWTLGGYEVKQRWQHYMVMLKETVSAGFILAHNGTILVSGVDNERGFAYVVA